MQNIPGDAIEKLCTLLQMEMSNCACQNFHTGDFMDRRLPCQEDSAFCGRFCCLLLPRIYVPFVTFLRSLRQLLFHPFSRHRGATSFWQRVLLVVAQANALNLRSEKKVENLSKRSLLSSARFTDTLTVMCISAWHISLR
jgi:hypothetical protein